MARHDFWSGIIVAGFGLLALVWLIPNYAGVNPLAQMPPDLVPRIGAWLMLGCGLIIATGAVLRMVREGEALVSAEIDWRHVGWALWPFLYVAVAIWFMTFIKLTWIGAPVIGGMLYLLGERRWYMLLGCSIVPVALLYVLSVYMMRVGVV